MTTKATEDVSRLLLEAGPLLFGPHWRVPLAQALGVTPRGLRYWTDEGVQPSIDLRGKLAQIYRTQVKAKHRQMEQDLDKLRRLLGTELAED